MTAVLLFCGCMAVYMALGMAWLGASSGRKQAEHRALLLSIELVNARAELADWKARCARAGAIAAERMKAFETWQIREKGTG